MADPLDIFKLGPLLAQTEEDVTDIVKKSLQEGSDIIQRGETVVQDTFRGASKVVDNVGANLMFTGRYVAKNTIGLVDNTQDHIYKMFQDVRVDVTNTVQIFAIIISTGIAGFFILYGDKILKRGMQLGEFSIF